MQQSQCNKYAQQMGWQVGKEYSEINVSGFRTSLKKRDALDEIVECAIKHKVDILLIYTVNRIGRQAYPVYTHINFLLDNGAEVWSVVEGILSKEKETDELMNFLRA